jgi:hypothetical protein
VAALPESRGALHLKHSILLAKLCSLQPDLYVKYIYYSATSSFHAHMHADRKKSHKLKHDAAPGADPVSRLPTGAVGTGGSAAAEAGVAA